jgi:hypothetical protein
MTLPPTNLKQIERLLDGKPASAAYPVKLPLEILKQIARDLRTTEKQGQSEPPNLGFAAPFLLIHHIVSNTGKDNQSSSSLTFDEETAFEWFMVFTYYIERELVGRVIGYSIDNTDEMVQRLMSAKTDD